MQKTGQGNSVGYIAVRTPKHNPHAPVTALTILTAADQAYWRCLCQFFRSAQRMGKQLGAQYFFTGKITSVDERLNNIRRVQYTLFLQVIEIETGLIRFQNEVARSKALEG